MMMFGKQTCRSLVPVKVMILRAYLMSVPAAVHVFSVNFIFYRRLAEVPSVTSSRCCMPFRLSKCFSAAVWAREHCRISPPRFLAECCKRRLNQGSFVLLYFVSFAFYELCLVYVLSVFLVCLLSCFFQYEPMWMALYSLTVLIWH